MALPRPPRFLLPSEESGSRQPGRPPGAAGLFAEGPWPSIRVLLERQGWTCSQIELIHQQLRQGWPLEMAGRNVAALTGSCPLKARRDG